MFISFSFQFFFHNVLMNFVSTFFFSKYPFLIPKKRASGIKYTIPINGLIHFGQDSNPLALGAFIFKV